MQTHIDDDLIHLRDMSGASPHAHNSISTAHLKAVSAFAPPRDLEE